MKDKEIKPILINDAKFTDKSLEVVRIWQTKDGGISFLRSLVDDMSAAQDLLTRMVIQEDDKSYPEFNFKEIIYSLINVKSDLISFIIRE